MRERRFATISCATIALWLLLVSQMGIAESGTPASEESTSISPEHHRVLLPVIVSGFPSPAWPVWLERVNRFRAQANLTPVQENPIWSNGDLMHARYMVKNDFIGHYEDPGNPWYTLEGLTAAQTSNLMVTSNHGAGDDFAIDGWMQAPFHALGILDPRLNQVGYGAYHEGVGIFQTGAALDVIRGVDYHSPWAAYPVQWPADGKTVALTSSGSEYPDPLSSCQGYTTPAGLPLILQLGSGSITPHVTAHTFSQHGTSLAHCIYDETTYTNPDPGAQQLGRAILSGRDAVVLVPRLPLTPGATYRVSISVDGAVLVWSFSVSAVADTFREWEQGPADWAPIQWQGTDTPVGEQGTKGGLQ